MQIEQLKRKKLFEEVVKQLQGLIKDGTLKPGDKLPSESQLALQFNVSRTAIREALRSLELMGFIESKAGEGTHVRQATMNNVMDPFFSVLSLDTKLIFEMFEVRNVLEVEIARLAAKRITPEQIKKIERILEKEEEEIEMGVSGLNSDDMFHAELAIATDNQVFIDITNMLAGLLSSARGATLDIPGHNEKALVAHRKIFEAIRNSNEKEAANAMREHLVHGKQVYETEILGK